MLEESLAHLRPGSLSKDEPGDVDAIGQVLAQSPYELTLKSTDIWMLYGG